jgi:hypothetical protein
VECSSSKSKCCESGSGRQVQREAGVERGIVCMWQVLEVWSPVLHKDFAAHAVVL